MQASTKYWLIAIFIVTLATRLTLAFIIPNFTYDSYFDLRQVEQIASTGLPVYNDELSYGGRELIFLPFFHYFMAAFSLIIPLELAAKLIPNILIATLTIIVYFISKKITGHDTSSLIAAFIAGFLPVLFFTNSFSAEALFLPLIFLAVYCFLNLPEKKYVNLYIILFLIISLTSAATLLIIIGLGIYMLLSFIEHKKINSEEKELVLFSLFSFIWIQFIFFKKVLLTEGAGFIWQNIPSPIIQNYFPQVSILNSILLVSVVPFLIGIIVVYRSLFQTKKSNLFLLISLVIATTFMAWLRFIRFNFSLSFFGIILAILFASFYQDLTNYLERTKLPLLKKYFLPATLIILAVSIIPTAITASLSQNTPSSQEIAAFQWLAKNTQKTAGVSALLEEGNLVTYYGKRRNLMDDQFSLVRKVETRFSDLNTLYTTKFQTQALKILDTYSIQYIVLTPAAKQRYQLAGLNYLTPECFKRVYEQQTKIYLVKCTLKETKLAS